MPFSIRKPWMFIAVAALIGACAHHKDAAKTDTSTAQPPAATAPTKAQEKQAKKAEKKAKKEAKKAAQTEAKGDAGAAPAAGTISCKSGTVQRTIEVKDKDGGCETIYTKDGESKSVATSGTGKDYCQKTADKIKGNLEKSGYTCQ